MSSSVTTPSQLDSLIQRATSESIPHGAVDLTVALEISDIIKSKRIAARDGMRCIKKRIVATRSNPNTNLSAWTLTELCLKNCGLPFIREVCSREFMDSLERAILDNDNHEELERMCKNILQNLNAAFKNDSQLGYVSKVYQRLTSRGVEFPPNPSGSELAAAMFESKTPADWVDSDVCMICSEKFTLLNRKHHCRSCGGIFCQDHSSHNISLPELGIYDPVRVCDDCYEEYDFKHQSGRKHERKKSSNSRNMSMNTKLQEDEELRRAIELSLKESRSNDVSVPVVPSLPVAEEAPVNTDEELDEDLKAAIEASLRDAEELKKRQEADSAAQAVSLNRPPSAEREMPRQEYGLSIAEEDDIQLFATLVQRMKTQPATAVLEDTQLQQLYRKVMGSVPKLNHSLNNSIQKYNSLVNMNGKISDIMNIYDSLLEKQLRSIDIHQQYSMPLPSDPYAYYNVAQQEPPSVSRASNLPVNIRNGDTMRNPMISDSHFDSVAPPPNPALSPQGYQTSMPLANHINVQRQSDLHTSNVAQRASIRQRPYPDEYEQPQSSDQNLTSIPSEPPYPKEDNVLAEPAKGPYPKEETAPVIETQKSQDEKNITKFDFPTVPIHAPPKKEEEVRYAEEIPDREELLIEL
ncbi:LADA_0B06172g1_1 [Lachancea dasiensis]|uniref:Vacuolar protein sorting-associated protein 27 n=1 Tax=Lachancea dasiensis TaxID=1072105 RepID=A0A1G4IU95_9SACH|nr:LADA_0B06172g1_1 [Lachancea dasiensis]